VVWGELMKGPLRFLALIVWGAFLTFIGQQLGIWVWNTPRVAVPTLAALLACGAAGWNWWRQRWRRRQRSCL
jgi:membrane protein DedA with SNARE-associated domain